MINGRLAGFAKLGSDPMNCVMFPNRYALSNTINRRTELIVSRLHLFSSKTSFRTLSARHISSSHDHDKHKSSPSRSYLYTASMALGATLFSGFIGYTLGVEGQSSAAQSYGDNKSVS